MSRKQPRSLHGRVAVVTGGGRGIGRALCRALAREGAKLAVGDVDGAAAEEAAAELGGLGLRVDVTDRPGFSAFLDEVEQRLGPIDVMVNNAGIMPITRLEDEDERSITRQLEINLHAVIHGTREAVRRMRPRSSGHIVNVASIAGRSGVSHLATYCATKHGVVGLSEAVRNELRGSGVEISVVMPGLVSTELTAGTKPYRGFKLQTPEQVADAIVAALKAPRFDVYVPASLGPTTKVLALLPRRAQDAITRLVKSNEVIERADHAARAAYEARAAASAPAAEAIEEVVETEAADERTAA
jgi:NAD(P)-dependent dehydrogenase (short-subunit alcohol dehydrogenase family)